MRNISENSVKELCWRLAEARDSVIVIFTPAAHVYKNKIHKTYLLYFTSLRLSMTLNKLGRSYYYLGRYLHHEVLGRVVVYCTLKKNLLSSSENHEG